MKIQYVFLLSVAIISGCAFVATKDFSKLYGVAETQNRVVSSLDSGQVDYWTEVKPILEKRCISCHSCYDAPCQLKLTAIEGIDRGASKQDVYNQKRLRSINPSRLFEDAHSTAAWRKKGFFPVLNEHGNEAEANQQAGVMYQLLDLKERNPLPEEKILSNKDFNFNIGREHTCSTAGQFGDYARKHPQWGMPYGLPGLEDSEQEILKNWLTQGARHTARQGISQELQQQVDEWEEFFNQDSLKARLSSRYIYEHLFISHIYFDEVSTEKFFKIVRSKTPPGETVDFISGRRPYSDPGVDRVYYRLIPELESIVLKTHLPYALNAKRKQLWTELFIDADYQVDELPGYSKETASNPFVSFAAIPVPSRYKFLLDEARFTIDNFIKGPVCRGQIALNVIRDQFWVLFLDPDLPLNEEISDFIHTNSAELDLANTSTQNFVPLSTWEQYANKERVLLDARKKFIVEHFNEENLIDLDLLWDGDGVNDNAALTVFRHFNSASVEKGLVGKPPETTWVITYSILERIHYLLVANFDIYGNVGHQILSRLQMDFLRIEGESNFLFLLPEQTRAELRARWYRETNQACAYYVELASTSNVVQSGVLYETEDHKKELYDKIQAKMSPVLSQTRSLTQLGDPSVESHLQRLSDFNGWNTQFLAEVSVVKLIGDSPEETQLISIMRNNARTNITSLFAEKKRLLPEENTITIARGLVGSYPNVFMRVPKAEVGQFVDEILALQTESQYATLLDNYGVRRTAEDFWEFSDDIHQVLYAENPIEYGRLDYGRLQNR